MKKAILFFMIVSAQFAQAGVIKCQEYNGQFQGTVSSIDFVDEAQSICRIKVSFSGPKGNYQRNTECPIDQSVLEDSGFMTRHCNVSVHDPISGYVKYTPGDTAVVQD